MDAVELIQLYETLFYVSVALTVLGFGFAVFFFFFFRIPDVRALMTGKARANTVRQIEEQNAKTGTLRAPAPPTSGDLARTGRIGRGGRPIIEPPPQPQQPVQEMQYSEETAVLQQDVAETSVLATGATVVLNRDSIEETTVLCRVPEGFRFEVTEATIVIHTDEII